MGVRKIFILCPRVISGGPENLHQLCDRLNEIGADAYIWYFPNPDGDHSPLYPRFADVRIATQIEDAPDNLLILPEMVRIGEFRELFPAIQLAMYWLSYANATFCWFFHDNIVAESLVIHLFHSYYEYAMIRPHLSQSTSWFFLTDYIGDEFLALDPHAFVEGKQDIVCFNGGKDKITANICREAGIEHIAIKGMSRHQVMDVLSRCKVYVDNGFHPGKDHLPREAAMHGCVVVTNKCGSAAYAEDVPIEEKVTLESDLYQLLPEILADYRHYFDRQSHYRQVIRSEKEAFEYNVANFWREISGLRE